MWEATEYFTRGVSPEPLGSAHRMSAPYQALRCADGFITVGAANDRLFSRLADVLGHPEWVDDPSFASDSARVAHRAELADRIESVTRTRDCSHWLALFERHGIPTGPINSYAEALNDHHLRARQMVVDTEHPTLGRLQTLGTPLKMSKTPLTPGRPAPLLGEHTREVLVDAGYAAAEIDALRDEGVVR